MLLRRSKTYTEHHPFGSGLSTWIEESPGFNLDRVQAPLLIGATEGLGSPLGEWGVYASLRMQNKPVALIYMEGQHVLKRPLERWASQQTNVDWFNFWLNGVEDPDQSKAPQYQRWERLRKLQKARPRPTPSAQ
jgi:hypothetical protein